MDSDANSKAKKGKNIIISSLFVFQNLNYFSLDKDCVLGTAELIDSEF